MTNERGDHGKEAKESKQNELLEKFFDKFFHKISYGTKLAILAAILKMGTPGAALAGEVKGVDQGPKKPAAAQKSEQHVLPPEMLKVFASIDEFNNATKEQILNDLSKVVMQYQKDSPSKTVARNETRKGAPIERTEGN